MVLGGVGMLGHILIDRLDSNNTYDVFDITRNKKNRSSNFKCDVSDFEKLWDIIEKIRPNFIVNCVGVLIKGSSDDPSNAIALNSLLPHKLVQFSKEISAKLIHISTDCVFDGSRGGYLEDDQKTAQDIYGLSKSLGEIIDDKNLTLRTSIIGPELKKKGEGLFSWFVNQTGRVNGFTDVIWGGVTTLTLSDVIIQCIKEGQTGLLHVTNRKSISKYDLLDLIKESFNLDHIKLMKSPGKKSDKSLNTKFKYFKIPEYEAMISEMADYYKQNYYNETEGT